MKRAKHIAIPRAARRPGPAGQTLTELIIAVALSASIIEAAASFFQPTAAAFQAMTSSNLTRLQLAAPLDSLEKEAYDMRAIYIDPTQCYAVCMVDNFSNRLYYYWDQNASGQYKNLYRKLEPITMPISCSGGKVFATNLDSTRTNFSMNKDMLMVTLSAKNAATNQPYTITSGIFPSIQERQVILSEGFECNTLRQGWTVSPANGWSISHGAHQGTYQVTGGSGSTTLQIGVDLSRIATAHLQFNYMNSGSISNSGPADSFTVSMYDGSSWHIVFQDISGTLLSSPRQVEVDLSGYALNQQNQIQFKGTLKNANAHWYVDAIQVFNP